MSLAYLIRALVSRGVALTIMLFLLLAGCSQRHSVEGSISTSDRAEVIENVPFVKQKDEFCGPAAMESVMRFYGQDINQEEIAEHIYTPKLGGALISDMENFAREMGYRTETKNGDIDALISVIDQGIPVIVIVDLGRWVLSVPHYYVVYGYDESKGVFILHTGFKGAQVVSFSELDKEWEKMNKLMLVVRK